MHMSVYNSPLNWHSFFFRMLKPSPQLPSWANQSSGRDCPPGTWSPRPAHTADASTQNCDAASSRSACPAPSARRWAHSSTWPPCSDSPPGSSGASHSGGHSDSGRPSRRFSSYSPATGKRKDRRFAVERNAAKSQENRSVRQSPD